MMKMSEFVTTRELLDAGPIEARDVVELLNDLGENGAAIVAGQRVLMSTATSANASLFSAVRSALK